MESKICPICKNVFYKADCRVAGAWVQKIYCSPNCYIIHRKSLNKNKLRDTFHNDCLIKLNESIKGNINLIQNKDESENADIEDNDVNYELEVFSNVHKWRKKYGRHRDGKRHVLYIAIDPRLKNYFDEINLFKLQDDTVTIKAK